MTLEAQRKHSMIENRIKRLHFEQERAMKLTDIATTKAEKLLQSREVHQKKLQDKMNREMRDIDERERRRVMNLATR